MNKWYDEEYGFTIEVTAVSHDNSTVNHCRNGEEVGDVYKCTYDCPVNAQGRGICQKSMAVLFPVMEAVRSGGDLRNLGGDSSLSKELLCPDGVVKYRLTAQRLGGENFHTGCFYKE